MSGKTSQRLFRVRLDRMIDQLRDDMVSGKLSPGDFLPSETALADQFGLSNKSVRQGLEVLVEEQLIRKIPRVGNQVTEQARKSLVTVTLGINSSLKRDMALSAVLDAFHRQYPSVRVNTITISGTSRQFIKEYVGSGVVDAFIINHQYFQHMEESGLLDTLEPLTVAEETYRFLEEAFTSDGTLYAQPLLFSPIVLCYNKEHFREAGLSEPDSSWTWDEALDKARRLTLRRNRFGLVFHELSSNRWPAFLLQSGVRFERNPECVSDIEKSPMLESIRLYDRIIHDPDVFPKLLSESSDDIGQLFLTGKASMILTSYMSMNELKKSDIAFDISTLPYLHEPRTLTVAMGICVVRNSPRKQAARLVADFMSSPEGQLLIRQQTLSIPALKPVAETAVQDDLNRPSRFDLFRDILPSMRFHRDLNLTSEGFWLLWGYLKQYWSRLSDDETLCRHIRESLSSHVRQGG